MLLSFALSFFLPSSLPFASVFLVYSFKFGLVICLSFLSSFLALICVSLNPLPSLLFFPCNGLCFIPCLTSDHLVFVTSCLALCFTSSLFLLFTLLSPLSCAFCLDISFCLMLLPEAIRIYKKVYDKFRNINRKIPVGVSSLIKL